MLEAAARPLEEQVVLESIAAALTDDARDLDLAVHTVWAVLTSTLAEVEQRAMSVDTVPAPGRACAPVSASSPGRSHRAINILERSAPNGLDHGHSDESVSAGEIVTSKGGLEIAEAAAAAVATAVTTALVEVQVEHMRKCCRAEVLKAEQLRAEAEARTQTAIAQAAAMREQVEAEAAEAREALEAMVYDLREELLILREQVDSTEASICGSDNDNADEGAKLERVSEADEP